VPGDPWYIGYGNTPVEASIKVAGLDWRAMARSEDQPGFNP
jgi:hypothetical protein